MKKAMTLFAVASGLVLLGGGVHNAFASNRPGAVTLTPGLGYYFFAGKRNLDNTAVAPTVALAYNFNQRWAIEGAYGTFGTASSASSVSASNIKGNVYTIDGLYRMGVYGMCEPYVSGGLGALNINPNGTDATNQANLNAGLGAQLFFDKSVALRAEVRDLYTMSGGKNDVMLNLGVSFLMGG